MIFSPYGNFHIKIFDDVVVVTLYGSSDIKFMNKLIKNLHNISQQFRNKDWALIYNVVHWDLIPPCVIDQLEQENSLHSVSNAPEYQFFLVRNKNQECYIRNYCIYKPLSPIFYVENLKQAIDFLNNKGFQGLKDQASQELIFSLTLSRPDSARWQSPCRLPILQNGPFRLAEYSLP
ncbi:MAG: hypothetical protein B6241_04275 [Spirochaetaceae bacterium 4572_59]|nr:MAG: hypothetical protein B6241_04275 [Spirochaetaceae bacterium 4572_59]